MQLGRVRIYFYFVDYTSYQVILNTSEGFPEFPSEMDENKGKSQAYSARQKSPICMTSVYP